MPAAMRRPKARPYRPLPIPHFAKRIIFATRLTLPLQFDRVPSLRLFSHNACDLQCECDRDGAGSSWFESEVRLRMAGIWDRLF